MAFFLPDHMKKTVFLLSLFTSLCFAQTNVRVATFDSGFGGYFTAKEIEIKNAELQKMYAADFDISHYGDTANAPYGEKTPQQIAELSANGISKAFDDGAEFVFIACNTASTQFEAIKSILNKKHPGRGGKIISIIESSVVELKKQIDEKLKSKNEVYVAILATPATVKAMAYLRALSEAYNSIPVTKDMLRTSQARWFKKKGDTIESVTSESTLKLQNGKTIYISQIGPANWVDMVEHGATENEKASVVARDLKILAPKVKWDVVGEFCTHFPAMDKLIKEEARKLSLSSQETSYIKQGPLMAEVYNKMMVSKLGSQINRTHKPVKRAKIFISGDNLNETLALTKSIFPNDPVPVVEKRSFR